uniref:39S ribosomal protein L39, mitochondrial n=1 Tax=Steinernema glaseri TaxID=37863 RepID=A0A1I7YDJ4_9BILA
MSLLRPTQGVVASSFRFCSAHASRIELSPTVTSRAENSFELFNHPKVLTPAFEFQRWAGNGISQYIYRALVEKEYSKQGFLNGSNQAIDLAARLIRTGSWERLRGIMTKKCVDRVRESVSLIPEEQLAKKLKFSYENADVVHSFLHSTILTGENVLRLNDTGSYMFCGTVVSFINVSGTPLPAMPVNQLGTHKNKLIIANATIARYLRPPGPWSITNINFFDYPRDA